MKLKVFAKNPAPRHISQIKEVLMNGGIAILPTDSVYAFACAADQPAAVEKIMRLKGGKPEKTHLSFIFSDLGMLKGYTKQVSKDAFILMNRYLPGPFTFILQAGTEVNKFIQGKKTLGVRIPENNIPIQLVKELGIPLLTASVHDEDKIVDYTTDPAVISEKWENKVDIVIDGGYGNNEASTILDCTGEGVVMIRQGIGEMEEVMAE